MPPPAIDFAHGAPVPSARAEPTQLDLNSSTQPIINCYISHGLNALVRLLGIDFLQAWPGASFVPSQQLRPLWVSTFKPVHYRARPSHRPFPKPVLTQESM